GYDMMPAGQVPSPRPSPGGTAAGKSQDPGGGLEGIAGAGRPVAILAPYAAWSTRNWPLHRWVGLEDMLIASGFATVILDAPGDGRRIAMFRGARYWGQKPGRVAALIEGADIVIGNDSGICHLAGVLGVPALAICGPTGGEAIFGWYRCVRPIQAPAACSPCWWLSARGHRRACAHGCDALWSVRPGDVLAAALAVVRPAASAGARADGNSLPGNSSCSQDPRSPVQDPATGSGTDPGMETDAAA
ncbi:MAG: glycosyltransferase family 9 protein, partial [Planctomycetota bacterium]|nr:glycosyltransferase family 9 protein [Planctomycetota bacterium]